MLLKAYGLNAMLSTAPMNSVEFISHKDAQKSTVLQGPHINNTTVPLHTIISLSGTTIKREKLQREIFLKSWCVQS